MFPSKAFLMSKTYIYQILNLNYYKKLKEWWTVEVNGDCISFNLFKNTRKFNNFADGEEISEKRVLPDF